MEGGRGPNRVSMGRTYTPWQTRMSSTLRAKRDSAWSTAALLPRCNKALGHNNAPSGDSTAWLIIRDGRLGTGMTPML